MKKNLFVIFTVLLFTVAISSCGNSAPNGKGFETTKIRAFGGITVSNAIQQIIQMDELLEKNIPDDVSIEWSYGGPSSADTRDALIAGKLDLATISLASFISAVENGLPLVLLSGTMPNPLELYTTRDEINSFKDINEHHKIGMPGKGSNFELAFSLRSKEVFGDASRFSDNIVALTDADMVALIQGADSYDLYTLGFPAMQKVAALDHAKLVEDLTEITVKYNICLVFVTTKDFYDNNPLIIDGFYKAAEEAVRFMNDNPKETAQKLSDFYEAVTPEEVLTVLERCPPNSSITNYDEIADIMYEMEILSKPAMKFSELPNYNSIPKG